ncbi:hypothetical protein OOU_Y34scaffold00720g30 [Pyricularia oryzae Y34]|uniref:Uncharacterized protein n=2 Tax=Pyricularia oryzae TaxID=318829 RepID=A0AA97PHW3_PYRO3|nr:hypothetical protein OOU_Y34scaffold00720g30 [Pyricularia oryzae Y34]
MYLKVLKALKDGHVPSNWQVLP